MSVTPDGYTHCARCKGSGRVAVPGFPALAGARPCPDCWNRRERGELRPDGTVDEPWGQRDPEGAP